MVVGRLLEIDTIILHMDRHLIHKDFQAELSPVL